MPFEGEEFEKVVETLERQGVCNNESTNFCFEATRGFLDGRELTRMKLITALRQNGPFDWFTGLLSTDHLPSAMKPPSTLLTLHGERPFFVEQSPSYPVPAPWLGISIQNAPFTVPSDTAIFTDDQTGWGLDNAPSYDYDDDLSSGFDMATFTPGAEADHQMANLDDIVGQGECTASQTEIVFY